MRKMLAVAVLVASGLASGHALAFDMTPSGGANLGGGQNFTDPADKLLNAPRADAETKLGDEQGDRKTFHFGDKTGGLTFQASPMPGPTGAGRYFSMETNPWR